MKRVLLNNLWVRWTVDTYMLLNVFTYRRMKISEEQFELLKVIDDKITQNIELIEIEKKFFNQLKEDCQVFDKATIDKIDLQRKREFYEIEPTGAIESITITLTYDCNFKCNYCYQRNFDLKNYSMSINDIDQIKRFLVEYHKKINQPLDLKDIVISGGEPLLEKNLAAIQHIFKVFPKAKYRIYTNGVNIKKYFDVVPIKMFSEMHLSLDGDDKIIRQVNGYNGQVFNDIIDGIKLAIKNGVKVNLFSVISNQTLDNYKSFLESLKNSGILESGNVNMQISSAQKFTLDAVLDSEFYDEKNYLNISMQMPDIIKGTKIKADKIYDFKNLRRVLFRDANTRLNHSDRTCNCSDSIVTVFCPDGNVYWCGCTNPKNGVLGTFKPIIDIDLDRIKKLQLRSQYTIEKCKQCDFRYLCNGGCPVNVFGSCDEVNTPACGAYKNEFMMDNLEYFL